MDIVWCLSGLIQIIINYLYVSLFLPSSERHTDAEQQEVKDQVSLQRNDVMSYLWTVLTVTDIILMSLFLIL